MNRTLIIWIQSVQWTHFIGEISGVIKICNHKEASDANVSGWVWMEPVYDYYNFPAYGA